jgi:hypothetical protein
MKLLSLAVGLACFPQSEGLLIHAHLQKFSNTGQMHTSSQGLVGGWGD